MERGIYREDGGERKKERVVWEEEEYIHLELDLLVAHCANGLPLCISRPHVPGLEAINV